MQNYKPLYLWSLEEAIRNNEKDLWRESYKENCDCARTIEKAITDAYNYEKSCLTACAKPVIEQYGFDRVNWVLANTVQQKMRMAGSHRKIRHGQDRYIFRMMRCAGISVLNPILD